MKTNTRIVSLALAALVGMTIVPGRAEAVILNYKFLGLSGANGCSLNSRIGKDTDASTHVINLQDCKDLQDQQCELIINWTLLGATTSEWHWYSKLGTPNGTCSDTNVDEFTDGCPAPLYYAEQDFLAASGVAIPIQIPAVSADASTRALSTTACLQGTDLTTNLYVIVLTPAVLVGQTAHYTGEAISFRFDLKPPVAPKLEEPDEGDSNITVKWSDPDNVSETGLVYVVYWSKEPFDSSSLSLAKRDGSYTTHSHQITGLENGVEYYFGVAAVDANANEGPLSAVSTAMPVPVLDFFEAYRSGPEVGHDKGGYCFIATAAYGSYMADQVWTLRTFRDRFLMTWGPGRGFVATYYAISPPLADFIAGSDALRAVVRVMLWPVVTAAGMATSLPPGWGFMVPLFLLMMLFCAGFAMLMLVRARRRS